MQFAIYLVFFLSGAASLIYEIVWMRQLATVFGVTTYAVATVLAVFMGGLAVGSKLLGNYADRARNPIVAYALLELGMGVYGVFVADLFELLRAPYIYLYRLDLPHIALTIGRALLACSVLLPPTVLMGGTLPVLAKFLIKTRDEIGDRTASLYFLNTAGAVAGCTAAGFYLIENLGNSGATNAAIAINFVLAAGAMLLSLAAKRSIRPAEALEVAPVPVLKNLSRTTVVLSLIAVGVSGFASLAFEVLWTRALLRYLYNSTYAFTTMLTVFLAGLALGSALYPYLPLRKNRPVLLFALLEIGVAVGFTLSFSLFPHMPDITALLTGGEINSFAESVGLFVFTAALTFVFPTICLGATLPAVTDIHARGSSAVGGTVGTVYAANTIGSVLGSLAATFLLIPVIGMSGSVALLTAATFTLSMLLLLSEMPASRVRYLLIPAATACALLVGLTARSDVFKSTFLRTSAEAWRTFEGAGLNAGDSSQLVYYEEGATDTVGVLQMYGQRYIVYEDMRGTASTSSYQWNFLLGHLPVLLHPGDPKRALHICFGVGNSLSAVAAHESIESVDSVELSPHVLSAAEYFWTNDDVIHNPKVDTIIDDGRNFVMATTTMYDIILLEPPDTFTAGVINLYTIEFYELVRERLADDGIFMQWFPVGQSPFDQEKMLLRSFYEVFPEGFIWRQLTRDGPILLIAGKHDLRFDYRRVLEKMTAPRIRRDLDYCELRTPEDIFAMFICGPPEFAKLVAGVSPVVDDKTVLDFSMARNIGSGFGLGTFSSRAKSDGRGPFAVLLARSRSYEKLRVSCMPYLVNFPIEKREQIEGLILNKKLPVNNFIRPIPEPEWVPVSQR